MVSADAPGGVFEVEPGFVGVEPEGGFQPFALPLQAVQVAAIDGLSFELGARFGAGFRRGAEGTAFLRCVFCGDTMDLPMACWGSRTFNLWVGDAFPSRMQLLRCIGLGGPAPISSFGAQRP